MKVLHDHPRRATSTAISNHLVKSTVHSGPQPGMPGPCASNHASIPMRTVCPKHESHRSRELAMADLTLLTDDELRERRIASVDPSLPQQI